MRAGSARLVAVDLKELGARLAAHIDRNHPRLGSALLGLRWGGLRTIEPDRTVWGLIVASGVGLGLAAREGVGRLAGGRTRVPAVPSAVAGALSVWLVLWRIDSLRWRRSHVTLVLELPPDALDRLIEHLRGEGVPVERHQTRRVAGRSSWGLTCRLRDLRRVNAAIDALEGRSGVGAGPDPAATQDGRVAGARSAGQRPVSAEA